MNTFEFYYYNILVYLISNHLWLPVLIGLPVIGFLFGAKVEHWRLLRQLRGKTTTV